MKKNTKKEQRRFYSDAIGILNEHCTKIDNELYPYRIATRWGEMGVNVHEENDYVYAVYMKFLEPDKMNVDEINKTLCTKNNMGGDYLKPSDRKWNSLSHLPKWLLGELDERLSNIKWLLVDENFNSVMSS